MMVWPNKILTIIISYDNESIDNGDDDDSNDDYEGDDVDDDDEAVNFQPVFMHCSETPCMTSSKETGELMENPTSN